MAALFKGVSVENVFSGSSVFVSYTYKKTHACEVPSSTKAVERQNSGQLTRAVLSLLLVMKYVWSRLICRSVTVSMCARSLFKISSPDLTSNRDTLPDSCPVTMIPGARVNAHTVAFEPMG